ncbi:MAG TPA: ABC transporter ATP-binding protein [Steroidobacteraceae bacterium]
MAENIVRLENVGKRYAPDRPALFESLNLELRQGEYLAVMGESGVGKSTLLNLLAGLDQPSSGRVLLAGEDLAQLDDDALTLLRRRHVGFVFQAFHVLPYLTVAQNVDLPLKLLATEKNERESRLRAALAAVGIEALASRHARDLSGGEVQRVAIARALIHRPQLLLADEPTGNLDARTAGQILTLLREQIKNGAGAGILITHSRAAAESADRILILDANGLSEEQRTRR